MKNRKPANFKLQLHCETLRSLDGASLQAAAGGSGRTCSQLQPCQSISYCYACITVIDPDCF